MDIYFIKNESGKQSGPYALEQVASLDDASLDTAIRSVEDHS